MARVTVTYDNHIAFVRLTRADKMNAVDQEMIDGIIAAGTEVAASDARAVVVSGEGKAFCAGIDITGLSGMMGKDPADALMPRSHGDGTTNQWQEVAMIWSRMDIPVIAAIHGVCFGAGIQLALGADIRIAAPGTRFAVMEMKWGIVPDMGGMVLLPKLVRSDVLRRMTYTAEQIDADQALAWGLLTEIADDPMAAATELATTIAGKSPSAIRAAKRLIAIAESESDAEVLLAESRLQAELIGKPHQMEVIAAEMGKRPAVFK
ncbi:Enoyl-CoA hydratase [Sulfitobacter noctilucicola]|uniref:Enoyl-CoA hydratase/carnithine racemase n=1 Tax=Sulfitobacter noctilucicola TaxID=1342301 RepID=A0A7W6Q4H2_9RHOB|nr:crotonase/enoyl-CoA hydratase family protein [Sulfitobacter noctilucicola]KIN63905.1 Enoyl-CoA hydratase [Sulfitobacter noctilucicola]MBB4175265.1 enoyl-CoA hydratase/carnithine racemase [Sulfitobacter noctilucicola]